MAFSSSASNLVAGDGNNSSDVFRKDMQSGSIVRCSTDCSGAEAYQGARSPSISPDGRYVGFCSNSVLVPGSNIGYDNVFLKDTETGKVKLCSSSASNQVASWSSSHPTVSSDGKYVFFVTHSYNLVEGVGVYPYYDHVLRKEPLREPPILSSISPGGGTAGSEVTLSGALFGAARGDSYVTFGGVKAVDYFTWSNGKIRCKVPGDAYGHTEVRVHTGDGTSNSVTFTVNPHIDLIDPEIAPAGCAVEIMGTGFGPARGSGYVEFGYAQASNYLFWSNTRITVKVPPVSGKTTVTVVNDEGLSSDEVPFEVIDYAVGFAEGYTGANFQEYLCIGNPNEQPARVKIYYLFPDGTYLDDAFSVPGKSRETVDVNNYVNQYFPQVTEVSAIVFSNLEVTVERPMYFNYQGRWTGCHDVVGTPYMSKVWCFAEGYTGAGFEEYICVLNPNVEAANLTFHFQTQGAGEIDRTESVPALSRRTFKVNELLGNDQQCSLLLEAYQMILAERSMYFDYTGLGNHHWEGGHCVMGQPFLSREYYFAEGTTRSGFEEWLTIQNPGARPITVTATYQLGEEQGVPIMKSYVISAESRYTVNVRDEVGRERDVSVKLASEEFFLAERPMYFRYTGYGASWEGGHCVICASEMSTQWFFAEGCTNDGFHEWLCLQNPGDEDSVVDVTYLGKSGPVATKRYTVPAKSRKTLRANDEAVNGQELSCSLRVVAGPPLMAEHPMYSNFRGMDGGHDVVGYCPSGSASAYQSSTRAAGLEGAGAVLLRDHAWNFGNKVRSDR